MRRTGIHKTTRPPARRRSCRRSRGSRSSASPPPLRTPGTAQTLRSKSRRPEYIDGLSSLSLLSPRPSRLLLLLPLRSPPTFGRDARDVGEIFADRFVSGLVEVRERHAHRPWRRIEAAAVEQHRAALF